MFSILLCFSYLGHYTKHMHVPSCSVFPQSLRDTLLLEEERVRTLVHQLGDAPDSAQLASSLEENNVLVREKKELQEKVRGRGYREELK